MGHPVQNLRKMLGHPPRRSERFYQRKLVYYKLKNSIIEVDFNGRRIYGNGHAG
jgi:hypothetical protein